MVVYRTGMLAITGSKYGTSSIYVLRSFCFLFYLVSAFLFFCLVTSWFGIGSGLILVVFARSRLNLSS